jgi:hypothetical protein
MPGVPGAGRGEAGVARDGPGAIYTDAKEPFVARVVALGLAAAQADDDARVEQGSAIFDALRAYFAGQRKRRG